MADVEVVGDDLVVQIRGIDRYLAFESRLVIPLRHVAGVESNPSEAHGVWHGMRMGGTHIPGLITAGRFVQHGEWSFWDVHDPNSAIEIRLVDEAYARLIIGVSDPEATCNLITQASLRARGDAGQS